MANMNIHSAMYLLSRYVSVWLPDEMLSLVKHSGLRVETRSHSSVIIALHTSQIYGNSLQDLTLGGLD